MKTVTLYKVADDGVLVTCDDPVEWSNWMRSNNPFGAITVLPQGCISTRFIGIDTEEPPRPWITEFVHAGERDFVSKHASGNEAMGFHNREVKKRRAADCAP